MIFTLLSFNQLILVKHEVCTKLSKGNYHNALQAQQQHKVIVKQENRQIKLIYPREWNRCQKCLQNFPEVKSQDA